MELKKLVRQNETGDYESTWVLTAEQMAVLFWYAVNDMLAKGIATSVDITPEDFEKIKEEAVSGANLEALQLLDKDALPRA